MNGEDETFTHQLSICLQKFLGFENSRERLIEYSTVTFGFDPYALLATK